MSLAPLEELFCARVITFLVKKGLLPPERARMLRGWTHSGFNVHRSHRVPPRNREDMGRLAQYIICNPFPVDKMQPNSSGDSNIYRSGMNPKIQRNFEVFSPCEFIARIDEAAVIERILRHLGLWEAGVRVDAARDLPEPAILWFGACPASRNAGRLTLKAPSGSVRAWKSPLPASNSGPTPRRAESDFLSAGPGCGSPSHLPRDNCLMPAAANRSPG